MTQRAVLQGCSFLLLYLTRELIFTIIENSNQYHKIEE